jgi:hypothetical protein
MRSMTRAFETAKGLVTPPPLHRLMEAVLLLWMSLVHGVATTLGMWRSVEQRDWHTQSDVSALPQAKDDIQLRNDTLVVAATRTSTPPPNGGGATRTLLATSELRWGTALTNRTVRTRRTTVPHLTCARRVHLARSPSPVRGRKMPAHA